MERMIDIAGHPTWMEDQGEGDPVLVLHGGISSSEDLRPLIDARIGFETMDTAAACRTYNVLLAEGRSVVAALLFSAAAPVSR